MAAQKRGAMLPEERALFLRCQRADDFKAIVAHLAAAKAMVIASDLNENEILSVFSNAGIPVFPTIVPDILGQRHIERVITQEVSAAIRG
jgi:hypothetical protein